MSKTLPKLKQHPLQQGFTWIAEPIKYMETAVKDYPDLFLANVVGEGGPIVFVHHPEGVQKILTGDGFIATGKSHLLRPILGNNSILGLEGDRHVKRRKLLLPPFHGERMKAYGQLICDLTRQIFEQFTPNQVFTARTACQDISMQVILEAVYGLNDRSQKLRQLVSEIAEIFQSPLNVSLLFIEWLQKDLGPWSPWGRFLRQREAVDSAIYKEIEVRKANPDVSREDILSLLISAKDEAGNSLTLPELRDELMALTFAGHETTAISMSWALYWIHHLPEVKRKLLAEIATLGKSPDPVEIAKLPYLNAVCKEALRIYPVGMLTLPRVVQKKTEVLGYELEPGQLVAGCIYLLHQREDVYPDAKLFKPERFLKRQFSPYEFIPFGGGQRACVGQALAQFEMKLAIATILTNYDLALADNKPELPKRGGARLAPARGVQMVFNGKRNQSGLLKNSTLEKLVA
ncbi:MAG: cytochrome P450 [Xenococcaceae cyanobacterium MO_207.B15]|nr:cytochrome P450 [Xenococcaceae cyanobacterium MO_207.B15]